MTQIDELSTYKHMQMGILEFMEAIARISEKINIFPQKCANSLEEIKEDDEEDDEKFDSELTDS